MADKIKYIVDRCRWQLTDGAHFSQKLFGFNFFDFPNFLIITSGNAVSSCSNNRGRCHTFLLILGCRVKDSRTDHWQIHFSLQSALPHSLPMVFKVKKWFKAQNIECNFNLWLRVSRVPIFESRFRVWDFIDQNSESDSESETLHSEKRFRFRDRFRVLNRESRNFESDSAFFPSKSHK